MAQARRDGRAPVPFSLRRCAREPSSSVDGRVDRPAHRGRRSNPLLPLGGGELPGRHMLNNVLAAAARRAHRRRGRRSRWPTRAAGLPRPRARDGAGGEIGGVRFVNDSKATNVEAARRSIESFDGRRRDCRRTVQGRRSRAICGSRCARRARRWSRLAKRRPWCATPLDGVVPVIEAASMREAVERALRRRARRRRGAGAGLLELRLVSRLRRARPAVQGGGDEAGGRPGAVSSRQSARAMGASAGNADYPGLRGGCPIPRPADDC